MLPAAVRVRTAADHRLVGRRGRRARRGSLVVSLLTPEVLPSTAAARPSPEGRGPAAPSPTRAGVVVGKAVGGAVVRTRVKRRLREVLRARLVEVPGGSLLVVRALPGADVGLRQLDEWVGSALLALSAASRSGRPQQPGAGAR